MKNPTISATDIQDHYHWIINSPTIIQSGFLFNYPFQLFSALKPNTHIDFEKIASFLAKRKLANTKDNYHLPLGKYVEYIVTEHFLQDKSIHMLQHNVQVKEVKKTIGEIDYLLEIKEEVSHVELAIKFYLCYENPNLATHWIGPNAKDNLANKLQKNVHAFSLTQNPSYADLWIKKPSQWQWILKGCWFYHPSQNKISNHICNEKSETGVWLKKRDLASLLPDSIYYAPSKIQWIAFPKETKQLLTKNTLMEKCLSHFSKRTSSLMFWDVQAKTRYCIVSDLWPNL